MIQNTQSDSRRKDDTRFYFYASPDLPLLDTDWWAGAYISNLIYRHMAMRLEYCNGVPLSMAYLKNVLGQKAQPTVREMLDRGVIKRTNGYAVGESSYKYALLPPYDQCQRLECSHRQLMSKIVGQSRKRPAMVQELERHARLLSVDKTAAMAAIRTLTPKRDQGSIEDVHASATTSVTIIADGAAQVIMDKTHGRVFAPHVTLNSQLRQYLKAPDEQPIVSLDIRNCQPLLLALAFSQYFHPDRKRRHRLLKRELKPLDLPYLWRYPQTRAEPLRASSVPHGTIPKPCHTSDLVHTVHHIERKGPVGLCSVCVSCVGCVLGVGSGFPLGSGAAAPSCSDSSSSSAAAAAASPSAPSSSSTECDGVVVASDGDELASADAQPSPLSDATPPLPPSCSSWMELASRGLLYEHFGQDREQIKHEFILVLFGKRPLESFQVGRQIITEFPEVAEVVTAMKTRNVLACNGDNRPYRYMACLLQLYESTIMIYRVCGRILKEKPDVPLWPIHDCIMTTAPHKEYVRAVIRQELSALGLSPELKEEVL